MCCKGNAAFATTKRALFGVRIHIRIQSTSLNSAGSVRNVYIFFFFVGMSICMRVLVLVHMYMYGDKE